MAMTAEQMLAGEWTVLVEEIPFDLAQVVEFRGAEVFMLGVAVGELTVEDGIAIATVGTDTKLRISLPSLAPLPGGIDPPVPDSLQAMMITEYEDDEPMQEVASLVRRNADRLSEDEVRRRIADKG